MDIKQVKKYLHSASSWVLVIFGALFLSVVIAGLIRQLVVGFDSDTIVSILLFSVMGGIMFGSGLITILEAKKTYQAMEESGEIQRVVADFATALPLVKDQVRIGQHYIFGKKKNRIVRYEEIRQVYQHITRTYFIETERCLKYVDSRGKTRVLCNLLDRGKSDEDVMRIMLVIQAKNPGVKLGYK